MRNSWKFWNDQASSTLDDCEAIQGASDHFADISSFISKNFKFNGCILDAGCGYGRMSVPLTKNENCVIALDASPSMLKRLVKHKKELNLEHLYPIRADIANLPLKNNIFDGIICHATIYYLPQRTWKKVLNEYSRVLKKDGKLYIQFIVLNKCRLKERFGEFALLFGKKRTWTKTYYMPAFMIKKLLYIYFEKVCIESGASFYFLCERPRYK